ncbi:MAG: hypothetical protein KKF46_06630 [Nanoarchaeota archaeon]|nr:hypothetical protein [Nanoarchaeota archaeon]MBU1322005.1 hypothetical protein [Nanoarchaeota archaeon]MBU1598090.1 hypothetical protein [Nanoarchaeota archaeon]MBU2441781.1 hypothetical protein [Nanoarchaeota archaeon]
MIDELKATGLSTYESRIIIALLKRKHTLKELSKEANIPPGKVYSVAKILLKKGLINATEKRPKTLFIENASYLISKLTKEYEIRQDDVVDRLKELATSFDIRDGNHTPFADVGTTLEDNRRIQSRTFTEAKKEVLQIINIHHKPKSNRKNKTIWEKEIINAVKRGVVFKVIYPLNVDLPPLIKELNNKFPKQFIIRRLDTDFTRCDIIDGKKVLIKLVHEDPLQFGGLIFIENKKLAQNLRDVFFKFWDESHLT